MVDLAPHITADPAICHGQPVVRGTRVLVSVLVGQVAAGMPVDEVAEAYRVARADVLAALAYAARLVEGEHIRTVTG